jgi:hypothetical protein
MKVQAVYTEVMRSLAILTLLIAGAALCFPQAPDAQPVRLPPSAFKQLPKNLLAELKRRKCTIPQVPMINGEQNIIQGEFAKPGQTDWAVLCSVGQVSTILVFWNASEIHPAEIAKSNDADGLQGWGGDKMVYSREIEPVGKKYIMEHYAAYGGPKPPPVDHQGLNDVFVGKASVVLYFYDGKWLQLSGAD